MRRLRRRPRGRALKRNARRRVDGRLTLRRLETLRVGRGLPFKGRAVVTTFRGGDASRVAFSNRVSDDSLVIQLLFVERGCELLRAPGSFSMLVRQGVLAMKHFQVIKSAPLELLP